MDQKALVDILNYVPKDIAKVIIKKLHPRDLASLHNVKNKNIKKLAELVAKDKNYQKLWKDELIKEKILKDMKFSRNAYYSFKIPIKYIQDKKTGDINDELALELILEKLSREEQTPIIQYLIQCGYYDGNDGNDDPYDYDFATNDYFYYPVSSESSNDIRFAGVPLYSIELEFSKRNDITLDSWKGNHPPRKEDYCGGNLPYKGEEYNFEGTIWTRMP